jgi:hypothetical protein
VEPDEQMPGTEYRMADRLFLYFRETPSKTEKIGYP